MIGGTVKKLIIVSGEKERVYAELLSSLIVLKDDDIENGKVVGIKDGSVEAVVWDEKVYSDNRPQLGSNTKILFFGKNKSSEAIIPSIRFNKSFSKYGIKIGWIPNKAVVYIEPNLLLSNHELYDEFFDRYIEQSKQFDDSIADTDTIKKATLTDDIGIAFKKGACALGGFFGVLFGKKNEEEHQETTNDGTDFFNFGAKIEASSLIPSQMYRYAILSFYLNGLSDFMEIK